MSAWIVLFYDCYLWNWLHIWAHYVTCFFFSSCLDSLSGPRPLLWGSSIIHKHTALGRTPLDERSARRRDHTWQHTTLTRQIFLPLAGFEPVILASERQPTHTLDRAATEIKSAELCSSANMNDISKLHFFFFSNFHRSQFVNIRNTMFLFSFFKLLHRASWYHQSQSFTNRCTLYQPYKSLKFTLKLTLTLQRGVTGTARMLHGLTHSSISRQVREQM